MNKTYTEVVKIVATFGLIGAALGFIVGTSAYKFIRSITENFVLPVFGAFLKVDNLQESTFKLNGSQIKVGEVFLSVLDLIFVLLTVYILFKIFKPHVIAVTEEKGRKTEKLVKQNEEIIHHLKHLYNLQSGRE